MEFTMFILRWIHFLAGVTWIGLLYYFNFVQTPFFAETEAPVRIGAIQKLLPRALWWFRWGAMVTFLQKIFAKQLEAIGWQPGPGFPTIVVSVLFLGGVQLVCLGILGEYLGRIYEEVKGRPQWIIQESAGFDQPPPPPKSPLTAV